MQMTVVAVMCHTLGAFVPESVGTAPDPICREVIVIKDDMPMQACILSQPALAEWKDRSIYHGAYLFEVVTYPNREAWLAPIINTIRFP